MERPWVRDERIHPVEAAIPAAGGYSFPSGHTARAVATWGVAGAGAVQSGKKSGEKGKIILGALSWGLTFLILFSRNYLGVHTPQDVLAALIIGIVIMFVVDKALLWGEELRFLCGGAVVALLQLTVSRVLSLVIAAKYAGFFAGFLLMFFIMAVYPFLFQYVEKQQERRKITVMGL